MRRIKQVLCYWTKGHAWLWTDTDVVAIRCSRCQLAIDLNTSRTVGL